jgi:benzylsuccinate CoA-transferase BbsF subunit
MRCSVSRLPLHGLRVLDFSWIIAGPTAGRFLAMMGAEVIKVGSARRPDPSSAGPAFQVYNQSKRYAALNISRPEGVELAKRLVAISDVVVENFAVGVFERLGLSYEVLRQERPDVVFVSSSGTGHTGPDKDFVAYGSLLQHYTGWNSVSGHPGGEPVPGGLWADPWVGMELAMLAVAALNNRIETGRGQHVDFSMAEALSGSIPEAILDYQMNGRLPHPQGNRDAHNAPHGAYRCKGSDRWIAIAVTDDGEWQSLCRVMDRPDLAGDATLAHADGRLDRQDELDEAVTAWTKDLEDYQATRLLQEAGVPAGPSLDVCRVFHDPHLRETGFFSPLETSDGETHDLPGLGWRFDDGPEADVRAAPTLGQSNDYVYGELLGMSRKDITRLEQEQVIY